MKTQFNRHLLDVDILRLSKINKEHRFIRKRETDIIDSLKEQTDMNGKEDV